MKEQRSIQELLNKITFGMGDMGEILKKFKTFLDMMKYNQMSQK